MTVTTAATITSPAAAITAAGKDNRKDSTMPSTISDSDRPVIMKFRTSCGDRGLHYEVDDDLTVKLRRSGLDIARGSSTHHILVSLDVDDDLADVVTASLGVSLGRSESDAEVLDRAIGALQAVRERLLR